MLLAHSNTTYVTEKEVFEVPSIPGTRTWRPVSHKEICERLTIAVREAQFEIREKKYALSNDGLRMFGVWELNHLDGGSMAYAIGIRNSMDKSMALGLVAGTKVLVCDNLAFSGEYIRLRRHTKGITAELNNLCRQAVDHLRNELKNFADWHRRLITYVLRRQQAEILTFRAIKERVLNPSQFSAFYKLYFDEGGKYRKPTLYHWHEAVTELISHNSPFRLVEKNKKLNRLCDEFIARYGQRL